MSDEHPPAPEKASDRPMLDERLVQWMAVQALQDRYARLAEGGADADARIELATLFVDLPVGIPGRHAREQGRIRSAMSLLLGRPEPEAEGIDGVSPRGADGGRRWLLVGGPGSGKTTLTTMVAQALRLPWIEQQATVLPDQVREPWQRMREGLAQLVVKRDWKRSVKALPLRVSLPSLARWMASRGNGAALTLWDYLAARLADDLGGQGISTDMSPREVRAMAEEVGTIIWILDGLDEVPPSAGRSRVIQIVRAVICDDAQSGGGVIVSTRPQGYEGEFDDLDPIDLVPLPKEAALEYAERLLRAWAGHGARADLDARLEKMRTELDKPEIEELVQTPLHTTMAALLASRGTLSSARSVLFEHYFGTILRRELDKPFDHGIQDVDEGVIRALHARAGLALQVRSQAQSGARSSLRRRELRAILAAIYSELGNHGDDVRAQVDRLMRFAAERLVLLLHASEGEYEFGVRSLQEFFAAQELVAADPAVVRGRIDAVVVDPHWLNVLMFVVSSLALKTSRTDREHALLLTVELCRSLNEGKVGGLAAARCFLGSRLAVAMLQETERYGHPWLHDPLWEVALEAADSPLQSVVAQVAEEGHAPRGATTWNDSVEIHVRLGLLAAQWAGGDAASRRRGVIEKADSLLTRGGDDGLNGWLLLHELLRDGAPEAIRLADTHEPATLEEGRAFFRVFVDTPTAPRLPWFHDFVDRHIAWFPPGWVGQVRGNRGARNATVFGIWNRLPYYPDSSIPKKSGSWQGVDTLIQGQTSAWLAWKCVARFMAEPSQFSLADVLEATANDDAFADLSRVVRYLPWPLQLCLVHAGTPGELPALSLEVRAGRFGSAKDWQAAEVRWAESENNIFDEIGAWLDAEGPWNRDIASRGRVVTDRQLEEVLCNGDAFSWLYQWIQGHADPHARARRLLERIALENLVHMYGELSGAEVEGLLAVLDERGRTAVSAVLHIFGTDAEYRVAGVARVLVLWLRDHPEQWGLLEILRYLIRALPDLDLSELVLPALPEGAPPHAHAACALLATLKEFEPAAPLQNASILALLRIGDSSIGTDLREPFARALRLCTGVAAGAIPLLLAALDAPPPPSRDASDALLGALYACLRRSLTPAFASAEDWQMHDLPAPYLANLPPPPPPPRLLRITELTNIRLFRDTPTVDRPFPLPEGERGQWIVLVGENGVGKTTFLRALALAIAAPTVASKLLDERLPMTRNGGEGRISIELDSGTLSIKVRRDERTELIEPLSAADLPRPWVVGYGVRRGNARGEKDREPEVGPIGELHTLFDRPASLHNAVQWLKDLDADVLREQRRGLRSPDAPVGPREGVWRSVQQVLRVLLGVTGVEVDDGGLVYVRHPQFDRVRLDALSDGYLTTAGWVIDMIARWIDRQQELDEPVGADVLRQMCGFVLLDEIDLHLHPMWQMRILDDVRRLFPKLSFVVTTHNPLTLQGARPGEVYVMRRDGGRIELVQRDIHPGYDVDRVLFEQFGVEHTFDRETRDLLAEHRKMLERGVPRDDAERTKLEGKLRERLGDAGAERGEEGGPAAPLRPEERTLLGPFLKKKG